MAKAKRKARRPARRPAARRVKAPRRPRPIPAGFHAVTPSLVLRDTGRAMDFWKQAFGAAEVMRMPAPTGQGVWHGEVKLGDSIIFCSDEMPGSPGGMRAPTAENPATAGLWVYLADADAVFDRAVGAGCRVLSPMTDMFWGDRVGMLADPFGIVWSLARHVKDMSQAETAAAGEEFARKMQQGGGPG